MFVAGGTGASLRVTLVPVLDARMDALLPHAGTWFVNIFGCAAIGLAAATLPQGPVRPVVLGGLLGGWTTYSAFGLLVFELGQAGRYGACAAQAVLHLVGGLAAVGCGHWLGRMLSSAPG